MNPADALSAADWLTLWLHFLSLSLLAVGGAITTAPDMHRYLVGSQHWLSDAQFNASIAIAQAAPGPNVLFVALVGWHVGLNAGGGPAGGWHAQGLALLGAAVAMLGILLPSGVLTYSATRWAHQRRELRAVRAFKAGLAPIVIALLMATGWLLSTAHGQPARDWPLWLLTAATTVLVWRTRLHLLWLIGAGALLGMLGWI
ncbi:MAG: chromate transporter [Rubrivivax sp.]|uniref:chromate transporter n=1 Tax=Ottowia sp. TaxID=1898956 RepID=UPI0011DB2149|nr:chromate transporter [Ottowia sp.]MCC6812597.1 chromate transporter [Rubrivivax sp.]MCZ2089581.1 chromate transporter [Burkholderiales bacterium]TXI17237.1 MAG: chromate transporter [Ottowia sp.]HNK52903.1 chromate transporter [Ottowia sp.]HNL40960.1 chromate transporter [Ottowia sp.]